MMAEKPVKDFDTLMRILRKLGAREGFFGELNFVFNNGNFVQMKNNLIKKPDDLREVLDP